ncbi:MAG: DUF554 domain-containing protein [Clostridia bacterium]|nr:DUF554 domain-containing protein [Clostridia bacterium]
MKEQAVMYFTGIGTVANMLLIIIGALIGVFFGKHFPQKIQEILMQAASLSVLFIGIAGALSATFSVSDGAISVNFTMIIILSMFSGGLLGQLLDIEGGLNKLGGKLQDKLVKNKSGDSATEEHAGSAANARIAQGFCACTILFCTGAMAIVGSMNDALLADPTLLYSKALLDGVTSIVFAASLGWGVLFSALSVGVYQGLITAFAALIAPLLTEIVIAQMAAVGSLIIVAIGLNLMQAAKLRIGNLLPAIFMPLLWHIIQRLFA